MVRGTLLRIAVIAGLLWVGAAVLPGKSYAKEAAQDEARALSLHYYRGVVYFESGQYDSALNEFQAVSGIDPYYKETPQYIKKTLEMLDGLRGQDLGLDRESREKGGIDLYFLGKSYYEKGDYRRAKEAFQVVLAKDQNDKFAKYYLNLCDTALGLPKEGPKKSAHPSDKAATDVMMMEKEVNYAKGDLRDKAGEEEFLASVADRRAEREELIQAKEKQLRQQEELLKEEKDDYIANAKLSKRAQKIQKETEKWKGMKDRLESREPGIPADLTEFPIAVKKAEGYVAAMNESLRASRWNSAGLNAIEAAFFYGDALLIYNYGLKSAYPSHENLTKLLKADIKRAETDEYIGHMRAILNVKKLIEDEDRPLTRQEAIFLADHAEKFIEWCRTMIPD